ncbi:MAG: nitroreductase family protein [Bacteroidales bacterium]|nr:nitroreductase family protein [Bacteroidales bacterium]
MKQLFLTWVLLAAVAGCRTASEGVAPGQNGAIANIMNRKSVRSFTGARLTAEQQETLLRAAMAAPTAMNVQPWQFIVLDDADVIADVFSEDRQADMFAAAGAVFIICGETTFPGRPPGMDVEPVARPNEFWFEDCAAATENLLLAAEALGLGAVWTACYPIAGRIEMLREKLAIPAGVVPFSVVPVGVPAGDNRPKDKWKPEKIHRNRW